MAFNENINEQGFTPHTIDPTQQMFERLSTRFHMMFYEALNDPSHAEDKLSFEDRDGDDADLAKAEQDAWSYVSNGKTEADFELEEGGLDNLLELAPPWLRDEMKGTTRKMQSFITSGKVSVPPELIIDYTAIVTEEDFEASAGTAQAAVEHALEARREWAFGTPDESGDAASDVSESVSDSESGEEDDEDEIVGTP
ncbi:hypothetical protein L202_05809 [Cryptococcus amylolentus CBS 6039]|uniref:Uncharacterized protein n=1 Tax=Cryptococcus amylolentus CBS 6039 TaxID=1295533 RepID=A0A1E3HHI0_9TREE|nr:hypothetical protein L202_05809 [Cryptococcus amylolentus CBS 6039]ODN75807.1 hypothetical protein L202_05809 [Cryptococcus amylolentus CBS 6039]